MNSVERVGVALSIYSSYITNMQLYHYITLYVQASHKKTFLYLEQLMLKHNAQKNVQRIKEAKDGLDFYYAQKQDARKLVDFIMSVVPSR